MNAHDHHDAEYLVERDRVLHPPPIARLSTTILIISYFVAVVAVFA
jgi:hypothetical protein